MKATIKQYIKPATKRDIDAFGNLIIVLPKAGAPRSWPAFPYAELLKERLSRTGKKGCAGEPFITDLPNKAGTRVALACVDPEVSSFELLTVARKLAAAQLAQNPRQLALCVPGADGALTARIAEALIAALLAAVHVMPSYKREPTPARRLRTVHVYGLNGKRDFTRTLAEAEGNNLARYLTGLPPNELTPAQYRKRIAELAEQNGWKMQFLDTKALQHKGAGAFLAVAQGSPEPDAGIVHLRYRPPAPGAHPALALVGKGICFDTGGMNLKPAKYMHGMHEDMEGSAVALGALLALTRLKVDFPVDCWLALAQNHIGPNAYKQNEVITASNGVTIEVMHTDAEGRMVLADTLALAAETSPGLIIDYATLTGACIQALGTGYSGAFTNRDALLSQLIAAGRASGERVWPFPNDADYDTPLDSRIADVKQCSLGTEPDHILAARFLQRFVAEVPWVHIDLAAGNNKGGLAHIPTDTTGFGVRFTLNLLLDRGVLYR